jgi:Tocopherol cyclase
MLCCVLRAYRSTGADPPFGNPLPSHGVAMEGYFWRFTDVAAGRVIVALIGVNRAAGGQWATIGLAGHPESFLRDVAWPEAGADRQRLGAFAGEAFHGDAGRVRVDLGPDARLDVQIREPVPWPRRALGGSSVFQTVPALNQYWHPHLLGARVDGTAVLAGREVVLDGATAYAEKNWGRGGFPPSWWWGQAQGFDREDLCVAFAGGEIVAGPWRHEVTAIVVRLGDELIRLGDPVVSPVSAQVSSTAWRLKGRGARWGVEIEGEAALEDGHVLPVPLPAERRNVPGAIEHLGGRMRVVVRRRGRVVYAGESRLAGLEHGGRAMAEAEAARRRERQDGAAVTASA